MPILANDLNSDFLLEMVCVLEPILGCRTLTHRPPWDERIHVFTRTQFYFMSFRFTPKHFSQNFELALERARRFDVLKNRNQVFRRDAERVHRFDEIPYASTCV